MKVLFMGTPDFAVGTLEALLEAGHDVVGVITQQDRPQGRKMELKPTAVKAAALAHGLDVYQPSRIRNNPEVMTLLERLQPDVGVVAAYGQIIPAEILHFPRYGCLNVHASLLPKYRGAAPIQWAVIDGEKESGVTIMQMDEGLDTGDMLAKAVLPLASDETGGSLFDRLAKAGAELLVRTLEDLEKGGLHPTVQPAESPTPYARMLTKADGRIDWTQKAAAIECLVRGVNPWPGAYTYLDGKMLRIWKSRVCTADEESRCSSGQPGTVASSENGRLIVRTGEGLLEITELQLEGKKRMPAADFLRGKAVSEGTVLG